MSEKPSLLKTFVSSSLKFSPASIAAILAIALLAAAWGLRRFMISQIQDPSLPTGLLLLLLMIFLSLYSFGKSRVKDLSFWRYIHSLGGLVALGFLWLHTGELWPHGLYERLLVFFFYLTILSGLFEFLLERTGGQATSRVGLRVIYYRVPAKQIPEEIAEIRERAEKLVEDGCRESQKPRLLKFYSDSLAWFFERPRFVQRHMLGSSSPGQWLQKTFAGGRVGLNQKELEYLQHLYSIAKFKLGMDQHFAKQKFLEVLRLIHLPASVAASTLVLWHIVVVLIYWF